MTKILDIFHRLRQMHPTRFRSLGLCSSTGGTKKEETLIWWAR